MKDGAAASPQLKKFASHVGTVTENVSEGDELSTTNAAQLDSEEELADLVK